MRLAKGAHPLSVYPDNLIAFWPLDEKTGGARDIVGGYDLTASESEPTWVPDPPVLVRRPRRSKVWMGSAASGLIAVCSSGLGGAVGSGAAKAAAIAALAAAGAGAAATALSGRLGVAAQDAGVSGETAATRGGAAVVANAAGLGVGSAAPVSKAVAALLSAAGLGAGGAVPGSKAAAAFGAAGLGAGGGAPGSKAAAVTVAQGAGAWATAPATHGAAVIVVNAAGSLGAGGAAPAGKAAVALLSAAGLGAGGAAAGGKAVTGLAAAASAGAGGAVALATWAVYALTVRLVDADGVPQAGATVAARRVRASLAPAGVVVPGVSEAVTDAAGVAVLYLLPSGGDAYRVLATAADGQPLLDVAVMLGEADALLHALPPVEGLTWH